MKKKPQAQNCVKIGKLTMHFDTEATCRSDPTKRTLAGYSTQKLGYKHGHEAFKKTSVNHEKAMKGDSEAKLVGAKGSDGYRSLERKQGPVHTVRRTMDHVADDVARGDWKDTFICPHGRVRTEFWRGK